MKTMRWTVVAAMLATSAVAQDNTNALPAIPAPATSPATETAPAVVPPAETAPAETNAAPVVKPKRKHVVHRHRINEPTVTLQPGPAEVAAGNINVRGQAGLKGEVIAHLSRGDTVNVLEQINLARHTPDEPAQWVKISYPTNAGVWVSDKYIDANDTVTTAKLNLRAGPGENYSVVGVLQRGDTVSQIETRGHWMKIEPPTNSYAFVAAMYLAQVAPPVETAEATPTPTPTEVQPTPPPTPETTPPVTEPNNQVATTTPEAAPAPETTPEPTFNPNVPRVVSHEGVVRHVGSIIAPTTYELYSTATDENIDFLYSTTTNLDLGRYVGMRIIVSGEEDLAQRWATPVLTVQQIIVVDTNAIPNNIYYSPRQQQEHHH